MKHLYKYVLFFCLIFLFSSCASYNAQYSDDEKVQKVISEKEVEHTFYLIGDAGKSNQGKTDETISEFGVEISKAEKNSTAIFLGDNIYEYGLPDVSKSDYELAKHRLQVQIDAVKSFKGNTIFIPGNHDWYNGIKGLKRQENLVEKELGKSSFLPENGCPIDKKHISDDIDLILIDSHWYVANWNNHPTINDGCDIKSREAFLDEFSSLIKKARGKTTLVALHHPMYTNGPHGGQFSFKSSFSPLPILGTLLNFIRKTTGFINVDIQNPKYHELKTRLVALAQENKKVIFVSGHEHSLQYLVQDNLHQIVSGSGSKKSAVRNVGGGKFGYGTKGYAKLSVYKNGSSFVSFYSTDDDKEVFNSEVFPENKPIAKISFEKNTAKHTSASIYSEEETDVNGFRRFLWGKRYRRYYSTKVKAPNVMLDTLFGGLKPVRKGGGNQSKSLRLADKNGAQYVMRALKKQPLQYLQATIFKDQYIKGQYENTATEDMVLDVFTGSHPYAPFVIGDLSDAIGVYHTNPKLYFVSKQQSLGRYNDDFGDELYMIEEHTSKGHSSKASFGYQDKLVSTGDMMKKIHKDEDIVVDEAAYIKARLFDMLIGDWDRHQDQWRWIEFKEDGKKVYRPMPRDRDQAFSKMSDGFLLSAAVKLIPTARLLRKYDNDLEDVKGVNVEPYPLDMEIINQSGKEIWDSQVKYLQSKLTDEVIEKAFLNIPKEIQGESVEDIKNKLKARRFNLQKISDRYFELINKYAVIKGTNKDDWFDVVRLPNGETKVSAYRIVEGKKKRKFHERIYNSNKTKEIWIYGLDDNDIFEVSGKGTRMIKVRLIGGQNNDTYNIKNGGRIVYYDYKSKKNTISTNFGNKKLSDSYKVNVYDYKKLKNNIVQLLPSLDANPDDGLRIGGNAVITNYGFERNPFSAQHKLTFAYYFATSGFDLNYSAEFANVFSNINFGIETHFNSPNYAVNFFGFGNETKNPEAEEGDGLDVDLDFNRVKISTLSVMPSLIWRGEVGAIFKLSVLFERNEVERTLGRFVESIVAEDAVFSGQDFYGVDAKYEFENKDNEAFPTLGFQTALQIGYKNNLDTGKGFGYVIPELGFDYKLVSNGKLVLATDLRAHINLGNDFEFYQGATLGGKTGLRGYRFQRFTGKSAFSQSTDIRWNFGSLKTILFPLDIGVYGGFDYGRVWLDEDDSDTWNNSYGGGLFINMAKMMTANVSAFNSDDGLRLAFRLGFGF